jgi:hypothetical protein
MSVRAKFKVTRLERNWTTVPTGKKDANGRDEYGPGEMISVVATPVYGDGDPEHENTKFWQYTPSGEIKLGTVNEAAGRYFELGAEYYVDFTKAE